jgi:hypothetical protein
MRRLTDSHKPKPKRQPQQAGNTTLVVIEDTIINRVRWCLKHSSLTEFDRTFLPSIGRQYAYGRALSTRQLAHLQRIEAKLI